MKLIGMLDSPFVRRVAVTMRFLKIPYEHHSLSVIQSYDEFRKINPLVKVPTLVFDDGGILVDSTLIIDHLESVSTAESLMPVDAAQRRAALQILGTSLVAMEKLAQLIYELKHRPEEWGYKPWATRVQQQLISAFEILENQVSEANPWFFGEKISQADVTTAIAWRFGQHVFPERIDRTEFPGLEAFSKQAESLPEFLACPLG